MGDVKVYHSKALRKIACSDCLTFPQALIALKTLRFPLVLYNRIPEQTIKCGRYCHGVCVQLINNKCFPFFVPLPMGFSQLDQR